MDTIRAMVSESGGMPNSMLQCLEIQSSRPAAGKQPIVDTFRNTGAMMCKQDFKTLEATIKDWSCSRMKGVRAWEVVRKDVLQKQTPSTLGFAPGFCYGSGDFFVVEATAIFQFLENLFIGLPSSHGKSLEAPWIEAMKGLGVKVKKPDNAMIQRCFKACVSEAVEIECQSFGWLKLVKACLCLEVARHVTAPKEGIPDVMEEYVTQQCRDARLPTLLSRSLGQVKPRHGQLETKPWPELSLANEAST